MSIDVRRGRRRGHIMYPLKQFKKFGHKNAIKNENRDLHLDFLTAPSTSLKRICKKTTHEPPYLEFQLLCLYVDV
jgi:hypothetical protein